MSYSGRMPGHLREALLNGTIGASRIPHGEWLYYMTGARGGDASHDDGTGEKLSAMPKATLDDAAAEEVMHAYCNGLEAGYAASQPRHDVPPHGVTDHHIPPQATPDARVGQTELLRVPNAAGALAATTAVVR